MHYIADKCLIVRYGEWGAIMHLSNLDCGGPDLNRRIPTEMDSESIAFDQARQPPLCNRGIIL